MCGYLPLDSRSKVILLEDEVNMQKEVGLCVDICPLTQGQRLSC